MNLDFISERIRKNHKKEKPIRGDFDLNPDFPKFDRKLIPAAVLIPLIIYENKITILLTRRNKNLLHHPGQISFPGGHVDKHDASPERTAIRETYEEVGVGADNIKIIGPLDLYETRTGFSIVPIVGAVFPPFSTKREPDEVDEIFEVPLCFCMDTRHHERHNHIFKGQIRQFHAFSYNNYFIWGATAGILMNLYEILK